MKIRPLQINNRDPTSNLFQTSPSTSPSNDGVLYCTFVLVGYTSNVCKLSSPGLITLSYPQPVLVYHKYLLFISVCLAVSLSHSLSDHSVAHPTVLDHGFITSKLSTDSLHACCVDMFKNRIDKYL